MNRIVLLLAIAAALQAESSKLRFEDLVRNFDYNRNAALDLKEAGEEDRGGVAVHDISYASPRGGRVPAYLVIPPGQGPFAAVLFGHWMMSGSPMMNRKEFLDEAVLLARSGAASLLIDSPQARPGFVEDLEPTSPQSAYAAQQQIMDFRRGLDLLLARPDIDPRRIAYVGHSFDAHVGGILAAVEKRIQSFVLMAGSFASEEYVLDPENQEMLKMRKQIGDDKIKEYLTKYAWDDPVHYVGHSAPAFVFLQFGNRDAPIPEKLARHYYHMFGSPKKIAFYDAGHSLNSAARNDRVQWLVERLGLKPVTESALSEIPELK
jgi:dienelactone hydrolase